MSRNQKSSALVKVLLIVLILVMIAATAGLIWLSVNLAGPGNAPAAPVSPAVPPLVALPTQVETQPPETTLPPAPQVVSTATLGTMGDLLMHIQLLTTSKVDGGYDFSPIFRYISPYLNQLDWAAANLETTFGGDGFRYQGNPSLNTPDPFAQNLKDVGFDMLLTANNHCGDTLAEGVIRTVETVRSAGLVPLGTAADKDEPKYEIVELNGIKIGMVCYTYATSVTADGRPALNLNAPLKKAGLVNFFRDNNLPKFYEEAEAHIQSMKADGAEAIVFFMHWGTEYKDVSKTQRAMAQKLCDLGVDAIIGGHPHIIQPVELLSGTDDPDHKTVVLYSTGNTVSNQRRSKMRLKTGQTEDGLLFSLTFEKYDDGRVRLSAAEALPFWVHLKGTADNPKAYSIIPLDDSCRDSWQELYGLEGNDLAELSKSYDRTMELVGPGLQQCSDYFAQANSAP